jgi:hypothetical protein
MRQEYERNHAKKYKDGRAPSAPPVAKVKQKAFSLKLLTQGANAIIRLTHWEDRDLRCTVLNESQSLPE